MKRYREWTIRQGSNTQCSPALVVLGIMIACGVVIYVYREIILTTIEIALLTVVSVAAMTGIIALTINTIRWHRRRSRELEADPQDWPAPSPLEEAAGNALATGTLADAQRISAEADAMARTAMDSEAGWLAAEEVDLSVDEHGKLKVRDARS